MSKIQPSAGHILTTGDVGRLLCVAPRTVCKFMDSGKLAGWRLPDDMHSRRTSLALLVEFANAHGIPLDEISENRARCLDGWGEPQPRGLRSGHWPAVRDAHLVAHPACEACGSVKRALLNVHHIRPFHVHPELELEESNLITLCESPSHNCHLIFGHLLSWKSWNVDVTHDAKFYRLKLANRPPGSPPPDAAHAAVAA